jgi:hypothetical protein
MIRYGDLQLIENGNNYLMIACDSSGGIGNKEGDQIRIEPELAGYYAAFVPIVEVLAAKGKIISLVNTLSVEMNPTGVRIIKGIKDAMIEIGLDPHWLTGSTEDNIMSISTGIGITVIGNIPLALQKSKKVLNHDILYLLGIPKVGQEFLDEEVLGRKGETLTLKQMYLVNQLDFIKDMIPVGSKGIAYEARVMAERNQLNVKFERVKHKKKDIDYEKSAGPSTCLLLALDSGDKEKMDKLGLDLPLYKIGYFTS